MSTDTVAKLIVNQVPLGQMKALLGHPVHGTSAMGDGCGGGCGGGAGCMDPGGLTGVTNDQIKAALQDKAGIKAAVGAQLKTAAAHF